MISCALQSLMCIPAINVKLQTQIEWSTPSLALQVIEYVATESKSKYKLIGALLVKKWLNHDLSAQEVFNNMFEQSKDQVWMRQFLSSDDSVELLKVYLASNAIAPKIQAFSHLYLNTIVPSFTVIEDCPVWIEFSGQQACNLDAFESLLLKDYKTRY